MSRPGTERLLLPIEGSGAPGSLRRSIVDTNSFIIIIIIKNKTLSSCCKCCDTGQYLGLLLKKYKPLGLECRLMLFLKSLSTSKSGLALTCTTAGACGDRDTETQSIWRIITLGHKQVRGTQKHRTGFSWVSGGTLDLSGTATLEVLDPAELDWAERLFVLCDDKKICNYYGTNCQKHMDIK